MSIVLLLWNSFQTVTDILQINKLLQVNILEKSENSPGIGIIIRCATIFFRMHGKSLFVIITM